VIHQQVYNEHPFYVEELQLEDQYLHLLINQLYLIILLLNEFHQRLYINNNNNNNNNNII